jgi:hypothetical protein
LKGELVFIYTDSDGNYDLDAEYERGLRDGKRGVYDPPSRDPVVALGDAVFGDNEGIEAAEEAYERGHDEGEELADSFYGDDEDEGDDD